MITRRILLSAAPALLATHGGAASPMTEKIINIPSRLHHGDISGFIVIDDPIPFDRIFMPEHRDAVVGWFQTLMPERIWRESWQSASPSSAI